LNRAILIGRLTRDPELRTLASGKSVAQFSVATNERAGENERAEFHAVIAWDRLAEVASSFLSKGQTVAVEGRLQTRNWDDDQGRHWRTEVIASRIEMISVRRRQGFEAETTSEDGSADQPEAVAV
jgi:single-strand DNA-binding protein